ncbi:hypothetical protein MLD38_021904 [Melastoma candidum]|uniref:Uncharacterized protein n=1 Tax=Melastoma candidum TaxID=119954 RepID=A0ACB9QGR0_9MYRT|nr:hypothetical protein MLD38_021904 [Melastoma candidum]
MMKSTFPPIFTTVPNPLLLLPVSCKLSHTSPAVRPNAPSNIPKISRPIAHHPPPRSAYIHLPFCRKRCHYCDFPIVALGSTYPTDDDPRISNYIRLIIREIEATRHDFAACQPPLETLFFGGGTPSLVPPKLVGSILSCLEKKFGLADGVEISMEMDPGTFDVQKMKDMMGLGVNRVSLGVQAFQEELLKVCGRAHGVAQVYEAIDIIRASDVRNWSLDLISSLPLQTCEMWKESLRLTIEAEPNHISVYDLQVEQGTKFGILYKPGESPLPSDDESADFYRVASGMLCDAGYQHYEISSYCQQGMECKHNSVYWKNLPFHGFGLGSASYVQGRRFSRPKKMREYTEFVNKLESGDIDDRVDKLPEPNDLAMDVLMLSLRTANGLDVKLFREAFGDSLFLPICNIYRPYLASGYVIFMDQYREVIKAEELDAVLAEEDEARRAAYIRLSDPDGFLLSNELISLAFRAISPEN